MKKLKVLTGAIVRGALLLSPGVIWTIWQWHSTPALINFLAAVGVETLFLLAFTFVAVSIQAYKKTREAKQEKANEAESLEVSTNQNNTIMKTCNDKKGPDKLQHAFVCFCLAAVVGGLVANIQALSAWWVAAIAFTVAVAAGVFKEVRDARTAGNHFCPWDLWADVLGALIGSGVAWLAGYFIKIFI